jgi:hypothetical protein
MTKEELGARLGPGVEWYEALESGEGTAISDLSLAHLSYLAGLLRTTPHALLTGPLAREPEPMSFRALAAALRARADDIGISMEELGTRLGWDLHYAVDDSEEFWNLTVAELQRLCAEVGVDWAAVLSGGHPVFGASKRASLGWSARLWRSSK